MDLSEKTGLSLSYVSMVENGRQKVSLNALIRIANILGVTVDVSIPGSFGSSAYFGIYTLG